MTLLEDALSGWSGVLVGVGAVVIGPSVLPAIGKAIRPVAKAVVKGSSFLSEQVMALTAETREQVGDLVAEVRAEGTPGQGATPPGSARANRP